MERKLSSGEWRLFLLSECIKYYRDIDEHTRALRKQGKDAVLAMNGSDTAELDNFIDHTDAKAIRGMLRKEWRFTGKVVDNGRGIKTTCEYCQKQQIRYKYLCRNDKTNTWLALGSVCVGYVIHGEDRMKDRDFANKFVDDLDKLKGNSTTQDPTQNSYEDVKEKREEQLQEVSICIKYLRSKGITVDRSDFLTSLQQRWQNGKALTDNQMEALRNMCRRVRDQLAIEFKSLDAEIQYQKVMFQLKDKPDNTFLQSCKMKLERDGELTPKMARALMGGA